MTNSDKAREICGCEWLKQQGECLGEEECHECSINNEYYYVMAMAKWKDEQFSEFLCSIRGSNMWEGREWRFEREWREFKESFDKNSE